MDFGFWEEAHRETYRIRMKEVEDFQVQLMSWWQKIVDFFIRLIPPLHRALIDREAGFFRIVRKYKDPIIDALESWEKAFMAWEHENAGPCKCGSAVHINNETEAWDAAKQLTKEAAKELRQAGWNYKPILTPRQLTTGGLGWVDAQKGRKYWEYLECFFIGRQMRYLQKKYRKSKKR